MWFSLDCVFIRQRCKGDHSESHEHRVNGSVLPSQYPPPPTDVLSVNDHDKL